MTVAVAPPAPHWLAPVAQALEELLWITDADSGRLTFANSAFLKFWGLPADDLERAAAHLAAALHDGDAPRLHQARSRLPMQGYREEYRVRLQARAGERERIAHLSEHAVVTSHPDGSLQVVHVARDVSWQYDTTARLRAEITRRTDAERSLDEATQRLQSLIATAQDAVITIDESSHILDWNEAAERTFGWQRADAVGRKLTNLIVPPEHRAHHQHGIERYLADGSARLFGRRVETRALRRDGSEFDVELSVWPMRAGSGHAFGSFVRDISRRKAAERALAESEAKYRQVVENVSEGILVTAAGRILYANASALALTGLGDDVAKSRPFIEFIHEDDRGRVLDNHQRRLRGEAVENKYQFRVLTVGGEVRWLEISGVMFQWEGAPATLNFLTDVTQRRQAEDEIRTALARERELSDLKSRFVAVASHEFRTPLAAILSSIELLDDYGPRLPEEERIEVVGLIKSAVARMNGMVDQVLLTSRLEAGQFAFEPKPQAVSPWLVQLASELDQAHAQSSRIALSCDDGESLRMVDTRLLRHILLNLLNNALKYSPPESPVRCTVTGDDLTLAIEVADQGIGIPPADLPRLFERFHRGTNVGNVQGTGMGLHIVQECVQLHGGTIFVDSKVGRGTSFQLRLAAPRAG